MNKVYMYNDVTTAYNGKTTINNENKYHKAGMAFHIAPNNVAICYVEMLLLLGL